MNHNFLRAIAFYFCGAADMVHIGTYQQLFYPMSPQPNKYII